MKIKNNKIKAFIRLILNLVKFKKLVKSINYFKYDWNVLNKEKTNFTPPVLAATITTQCNLRCPTCLYLLEDKKYLTDSYMGIFSFHKYLNRIKAKKADIIYFTGGEPLLNDDLGSMVDLCKEKYKLKTKISTNGILIKNKIETLRKFDEINVSLDAYDSTSFKKYRGGSENQWKDILIGLRILEHNFINYSISFLLSDDNAERIIFMLYFASSFSPTSVYFHNINPHGNNIRPLFNTEDYWFARILLNSNYKYDISLPYLFKKNNIEKEIKCIQPWYYQCFDPDFKLAPCCHLKHIENLDIKKIRRSIINGELLSDSCKYCQRRFMGENYATFNSKKGKWNINEKFRRSI